MNKFTKIAVVAAGTALALQSAFAGDNDLIFSVNNNDGGGASEFNVNLGQVSSFSSPNFDLSSFVSTFNTYASHSASGLNVGAVAGINGQGGIFTPNVGNDLFTTTLRVGGGSYLNAGTETGPTPSPSATGIGTPAGIAAGLNEFGANVAVGDTGSFTSQIAKNPTTAGTQQNTFVSLLGGDNPLQKMTGTSIVLDLWQDTVNGGGDTTTGWTYVGNLTFTLGDTPSLVWDAAPVPEPSTYGLFAGAGLLALSLRRQFARKNA